MKLFLTIVFILVLIYLFYPSTIKNEAFTSILADNKPFQFQTLTEKIKDDMNDKRKISIKTDAELNNNLTKFFKQSSINNPFGNVLLTEINDEPHRKPAPPSFESNTKNTIDKNIKDLLKTFDTYSTSYKPNLYDEFLLDQSNRVFYTMPNTKVASDQGAFSKYLYSNMLSGKDNPLGAWLYRHIMR